MSYGFFVNDCFVSLKETRSRSVHPVRVCVRLTAGENGRDRHKSPFSIIFFIFNVKSRRVHNNIVFVYIVCRTDTAAGSSPLSRHKYYYTYSIYSITVVCTTKTTHNGVHNGVAWFLITISR